MAPDVKQELDAKREQMEKDAVATNASRTGVGTRVKVGATRGRNVSVISYEAFDDSLPDTLPKSVKQFMEVTGKTDEPTLVEYLITGYNDASYSAASDEIGEFVNPAWSDNLKLQFRTAVRNYARGIGSSIEDAVGVIKPGIEAAFAAGKVK